MCRSLYEIICENLNSDGILPDTFHLPDEAPESKAKFAPGATDGIMLYHIGHSDMTDSDEMKFLKEALASACDDKCEEAFEKIHEFAKKGKALAIADCLLQYIVDNQDSLPAASIYNLAYKLIRAGYKIEAVKIGLITFELFDVSDDEILSVVRTLGLCDEFSFFAGMDMLNLDNGNAEIFDMVQKVKGWGRVHLVRLLKNDTEEVEEWLILSGVDNDIVPAYSALEVYEKIPYIKLLTDPNLDLKHYRGLSDIMSALLDEGPVSGISAIDGCIELLKTFISITNERTDLNDDDLKVLTTIDEYIKENEGE